MSIKISATAFPGRVTSSLVAASMLFLYRTRPSSISHFSKECDIGNTNVQWLTLHSTQCPLHELHDRATVLSLLLSHRPHRCWSLGECWRQNCTVVAFPATNYVFCLLYCGPLLMFVWTVTLSDIVRWPCSLATLIIFLDTNNNNKCQSYCQKTIPFVWSLAMHGKLTKSETGIALEGYRLEILKQWT